MPRSSWPCSSSSTSRSSSDGSSSTTTATLSSNAANRCGSSPRASSTSCSNSRREIRITLPARDDVEAEHPLAVRPLERTGVVDLDGDVAQQEARAEAGAEDRHALGGVGLEGQLQLLIAGGAGVVLPLLAPGGGAVDERLELGGDESRQQAELLRSEQRHAHLGAGQRDLRALQPVEDRASGQVDAVAQIERAEVVAADQSEIAEVERRDARVVGAGAVAAVVQSANGEGDRVGEPVLAPVGQRRLELQIAGVAFDLVTIARAAQRRDEAEDRAVADERGADVRRVERDRLDELLDGAVDDGVADEVDLLQLGLE